MLRFRCDLFEGSFRKIRRAAGAQPVRGRAPGAGRSVATNQPEAIYWRNLAALVNGYKLAHVRLNGSRFVLNDNLHSSHPSQIHPLCVLLHRRASHSAPEARFDSNTDNRSCFNNHSYRTQYRKESNFSCEFLSMFLHPMLLIVLNVCFCA